MDLVVIALCLGFGAWLILGRASWSRNVAQLSLLGSRGSTAAAALGGVFVIAGLVLAAVAALS